MVSISESIGRSALLAAASNYQSVAEALMELIDNPFDKRRGRHLAISIWIEKKNDRITITDSGGEGMNEKGLQEWIRWGEGEQHAIGDIGQYHVGGKLAAVYLADALEIICRKSGESKIWRFFDPRWGSRTEVLDTSQLTEVRQRDLLWRDSVPSRDIGFTEITLTKLKPNRYDVGILRERLSDTYRSLIENNECTIRVDGKTIITRRIPWSSTITVIEIPKADVCQGVKISGRIGAIDRDQIPDGRGIRIPAGIRTEFNGRKISDGEEFGHKLSGKGNLQRVYGEIEIRGRALKPNQLKNGWPRDGEAWTALEAYIHECMQPIVSHLNKLSDTRPASREERKRASNARRRVQTALKRLERLRNLSGRDLLGEHTASRGRKSPSSREELPPKSEPTNTRGPTKNPTPPPDDPVGRLVRRVGGMPDVIYDQLGKQTPRTQSREQENRVHAIVINTDYPLYASLGESEDYVFESLIAHIVYNESESSSISEAQRLFDQLVWLDKAEEEVSASTNRLSGL